MNLLRILILLPLSIFSDKLSAQIEDLMRDKNITWIAETYNDFQMEEVHETLIGKKLNAVSLQFFQVFTKRLNTQRCCCKSLAKR